MSLLQSFVVMGLRGRRANSVGMCASLSFWKLTTLIPKLHDFQSAYCLSGR